MSRNLESEAAVSVAAPKVQPRIAVELDFPSGWVRAWDGIGPLLWDGKTFSGVGSLGGLSAPEESTDLRANSLTVQLSGIPVEIAAKALDGHYQGRPAAVWFFTFKADGTPNASPFKLFAGQMDFGQKVDSGDTSVISISIEGHMVNLQVPRIRRFCDADQKARYPADRGLEFIAGLQTKQITFGG
jgi:hypothetical protein